MQNKIYVGETKHKPDLYAMKEKPKCPFCGENYEKIKTERNTIEHPTEKFLWTENAYPVLEDMDMTLILMLDECNEGIADYSVEMIQNLINFTFDCADKMKKERGYKEVVMMQNFGYLSGGSVPHPHLQLNGIKNDNIKMRNHLSNYNEGHLIVESEDKLSRATFPTNPLSEKYEVDVSWKGKEMTKEAALFLKQAVDFTRHYHPTRYRHYNLSFNYDEVNDIYYIKVIYREPVSLYLFLDLHMTIKDPSDFILKFRELYGYNK